METLVSTETLIAEIIYLIKDKDYIWFRFTWSKVGTLSPIWIVWLETLNGTTLSFHHTNLNSALHILLNVMKDTECPV